MDLQKLKTRYRQFGGMRLVWQYAKLHALWPAAKAGLGCLIHRKSFKAIYPAVLKKVEPFLIQRYKTLMRSEMEKIRGQALEHNHNKIIWFCWLQGFDKFPPIVNACYHSIKRSLSDRDIKIVDNKNWKEYVQLPDYVVNKWEKRQIPASLFSDLLRLELLIKYGGTWIDSTVLCTGFNGSKAHKFKAFLDADLFLFLYSKQGTIPVSISNWFISASTNNEILIVLRDMLYAYWKDFDCTLDYYIFHLFFSLLSKEYPEAISTMPYGASQNSLALLHHWGDEFSQEKWDRLVSNVCFHKLAFRVSDDVLNNKKNYYNHILREYGCF